MEKFNVIVVVCDTLRKDVLSIYGGGANTPALELLARDSVVFRNCFSTSPWTLPSHVSMFTGLYARDHKVHEEIGGDSAKMAEALSDYNGFWLPTYMQELGYNTMGFSGNFVVSPSMGFGRGFDAFFFVDRMINSPYVESYREVANPVISEKELLLSLLKRRKFRKIADYARIWRRTSSFENSVGYPRDKSTRAILNLIDNSTLRENFFIFLNMFEMHEPYVGEKRKEAYDDHYGVCSLSQKRVNHLKLEYMREVEYLDKYIGRLISILKRKGTYDSTMIIVTSDHGQAFKEHGYLYHGSFLYDEIIAVPLLVKPPVGIRVIPGRGVQSLISIPKAISELVEGSRELTFDSETVFAESYSNEWTVSEEYLKNLSFIEKTYYASRIAVMKREWKLSINGRDAVVEEFTQNGNNTGISQNSSVYRELLTEAQTFGGEFQTRQNLPQFDAEQI